MPLTFANPQDYEKVSGDDLISIVGLDKISPGKSVEMVAKNPNTGNTTRIELNHTLNDTQIAWFKAGSALNWISKQKL